MRWTTVLMSRPYSLGISAIRRAILSLSRHRVEGEDTVQGGSVLGVDLDGDEMEVVVVGIGGDA
jgi:hypothetical protein